MKFHNHFDVQAPIDEVFRAVLDVERVASCVPGAKVLERESDDARRVGIEVHGREGMEYRGDVEILEADEANHRAVVRAQAEGSRGQGSASATVEVVLREEGGMTHGDMTADVSLTEEVAGPGGGETQDVSSKVFDGFSRNLAEMLGGGAPAAGDGAQATRASTPPKPPEPSPATVIPAGRGAAEVPPPEAGLDVAPPPEEGLEGPGEIAEREIAAPAEATRARDIPQPAEATQARDIPQPAEATQARDIPQPAEATQARDIPQPAEATQARDIPQPAEATQARDIPDVGKAAGVAQPAEVTDALRVPEPADVTQERAVPPAAEATEPDAALETPEVARPVDAPSTGGEAAPPPPEPAQPAAPAPDTPVAEGTRPAREPSRPSGAQDELDLGSIGGAVLTERLKDPKVAGGLMAALLVLLLLVRGARR